MNRILCLWLITQSLNGFTQFQQEDITHFISSFEGEISTRDSLELDSCKLYRNEAIFTGLVINYDDTILREVYTCVDGIKNGVYFSLYDDLSIETYREYWCGESSALEYRYVDFFPEGQLMGYGTDRKAPNCCEQSRFESIFGSNEHELVPDGQQVMYYDNGQIRQEYLVLNNQLRWSRYYYENGQLKEHHVFDGQRKISRRLKYYENGQLEYEQYYTNGKPTGTWNLYDSSGKRYGKVKVKNGYLKGHWHEPQNGKSTTPLKDCIRIKVYRSIDDWGN